MNKKTLIISLVVLIVILIVGFLIFQGIRNNNVDVENSLGGTNTQSTNNQNQAQIEVEADGISGEGELTICIDECWNGTCQQPAENCGQDGTYSCVCPEDPEICPQDCK